MARAQARDAKRPVASSTGQCWSSHPRLPPLRRPAPSGALPLSIAPSWPMPRDSVSRGVLCG
jgi:hypothetical protein